jgi:nucleotide-binding universal stress UspA family protein
MARPAKNVRKKSMEDVHRSVAIPASRWWRRLFAFAGPAYLVSVGYMDPGNWAIDTVLGYGDASTEIVNITRDKGIDLMVLGGHGHRGLLDLVHGTTITSVRHGLTIPVITVRGR